MTSAFPDETLRRAVHTVSCLSMDAVQLAQSGHPGTPMGLANIGVEIFARYLRHDPRDPAWIGRDRFVLSAGHASMLVYSLLHLSGYDLSLDDLKAFRQWGSRTPGHPEVGHTPGVETTTGPLGQGVGNAVGMALGLRMQHARFGAPFEDARVYAIASDGDVMEGVASEASSIAGHLGLGNLVVFYDDNRITIEGATDLAFSEDVGMRYEAYGWFVQRIDGHDHQQIRAALDRARAQTERPSFIVARTHIAHGAPHAQDTAEAHGAPLGAEEIARTKAAMGPDLAQPFVVPADVRSAFERRVRELEADRDAWNRRFATWRAEDPARATALDAFFSRELPADLAERIAAAVPAKDDATRGLSGAIQQRVAELVPGLVGGSADLGPSTKTLLKGSPAIARRAFEGRNLHFGIREHGMGAVCNGLALAGGFLPYGSTFLVFSDYMRPSVRLSALCHLPCLWIYTHDSVLLGEDGPTHQPIEHLASLRLIPGLHVVRPADGLECAAAWVLALQRCTASRPGPTAFSLTRQKVPTLPRPAGFAFEDMLRGAYVVREPEGGGSLDAVVLSTGSEVAVACDAALALAAKGKRVRVVSVLCLERFAECSTAEQERVVPRGVRRVSLEAGRTDGWRGWVGPDGLTLGIDSYGASAPDHVLREKFGLTSSAVKSAIEEWLAR